MDEKIKNAIEEYQCPGCISGSNTKCASFKLDGAGCAEHFAGTLVTYIGKIALGMCKGFNRVSVPGNSPETIHHEKYEDFFEDETDVTYNIPLQKWKNEKGQVEAIVYAPRINHFMRLVFEEDCMNKLNCPKQYIQDLLFHNISKETVKLEIFEKLPEYDFFRTRLAWKHLNENGHTLIRGVHMAKGKPFIHVILEDCMDEVECFEVSQELVDYMD